MTKYIQGKDGKFAGSIGDGKNKVPTAPGQPPVDAELMELRSAMAAAHVPSKMSIWGKTIAKANDDLEAAEQTRRAYLSAKLDRNLDTLNKLAAERGQHAVTDAERAAIIDNAEVLYDGEDTAGDASLISRIDRYFVSAVGATLFASGARLQQRGLKGWIASRTSDRIAKRIATLKAEQTSNA